ncbi:MAG: type II secretion system F family protein [bacterium]|nr:type II secretion system F family protein [bacterium]
MAKFNYEALDKAGKTVKGSIEAESEDIIIERLRGMGYFPTKVTRIKTKVTQLDLGTLPVLKIIFGRIKSKHISTFTRQLATLIEAGLPLLRSLNILEEQVESANLKKIIVQLAKGIEAGGNLSEGLAQFPKVFSKLYVNMVKAGEIGGVLEVVLERIATFLENAQALKSKIRSAMMYPVMVMVVATIIITFILVGIIPRFVAIYAELGAELPLPTMLLIEASKTLTEPVRAAIFFSCIIGLIIAYRYTNKTSTGKFYIDSAKLKLPVFGQLINKIAIARFAATLATLITSGVPILQALEIVRETSGNEVIARAMQQVHDSIREGETIHEPLSKFPVFPPLVVHMIAVGEETGALDTMLNKVAESYEREVDDTVKGLTSLIEPLLIVGLGIIIGFIVVALYLPLFNIVNAIK